MTVSGSGSPVPPVFPGNGLRVSAEEEVVDDLVETLIDSVRSYLTAAGKVDDADLATLMRSRAEGRRDLIERLLRSSRLDERDIDFEGTPAGAMRRAWMAFEDRVAGDDAIVKSVIRGEKHALRECEDAVEENLEASTAELVQRTATDISDAIELLEARLG